MASGQGDIPPVQLLRFLSPQLLPRSGARIVCRACRPARTASQPAPGCSVPFLAVGRRGALPSDGGVGGGEDGHGLGPLSAEGAGGPWWAGGGLAQAHGRHMRHMLHAARSPFSLPAGCCIALPLRRSLRRSPGHAACLGTVVCVAADCRPAVPHAQPPVCRPRKLSWDHTALLAWAVGRRTHWGETCRSARHVLGCGWGPCTPRKPRYMTCTKAQGDGCEGDGCEGRQRKCTTCQPACHSQGTLPAKLTDVPLAVSRGHTPSRTQ